MCIVWAFWLLLWFGSASGLAKCKIRFSPAWSLVLGQCVGAWRRVMPLSSTMVVLFKMTQKYVIWHIVCTNSMALWMMLYQRHVPTQVFMVVSN